MQVTKKKVVAFGCAAIIALLEVARENGLFEELIRAFGGQP